MHLTEILPEHGHFFSVLAEKVFARDASADQESHWARVLCHHHHRKRACSDQEAIDRRAPRREHRHCQCRKNSVRRKCRIVYGQKPSCGPRKVGKPFALHLSNNPIMYDDYTIHAVGRVRRRVDSDVFPEVCVVTNTVVTPDLQEWETTQNVSKCAVHN